MMAAVSSFRFQQLARVQRNQLKGRFQTCVTLKHARRSLNTKSPASGSNNSVAIPDGTLVDFAEIVNHSPRKAKLLQRSLSRESLEALAVFVAKESSTANVQPPSARQLRLVALEAAIPFVGFGFVDNAIMIMAGDYIDLTFGVALGISTMAAAGLGNLVSDVFGIGIGGVVESFAARLGLPSAGVSRAQEKLRVTRIAQQGGCAIGVIIGCLLGMFPLLFLDTNQPKRAKRQQEIDDLFSSVLQYVGKALKCEHAQLYLVDQQHDELWTQGDDASSAPVRTHLHQGLAGQCASSGIIINRFYTDADRAAQGEEDEEAVRDPELKSVLYMPILDREKEIIGVLKVRNKAKGKRFSEDDERLLGSMASHISVALEHILHDDESQKLSVLAALQSCADHRKHVLRFASGGQVGDRYMKGTE